MKSAFGQFVVSKPASLLALYRLKSEVQRAADWILIGF